MKKTYKNPTLKVVKIQPAQVIATSVQNIVGAEGMKKGTDWTEGTAGARGGRFSNWEDDEE